jgi:transcriptional regulator with XRE-family HTH domain
MEPRADGVLSDEDNRAVAEVIREELARRRITRQFLADQARISISTLEKALSGRRPFTLMTMIRLEQALGVPLRHNTKAPPGGVSPLPGIAPQELGCYARPAVAWIEGTYLTLRPSFGERGALYAYRTEIAWDEGASRLIFRESDRLDTAFTQDGSVSVPHQSGYIYLITNKFGQYRLVIVARPTIDGEMHGILTTLQAGRGSQLTPIATSIVFIPLETLTDIQFGRIGTGHPCHERYRRYLRRTIDEPFALFLPG